MRRGGMRTGGALPAVALAVVLAGCGSAAPPPTSLPTSAAAVPSPTSSSPTPMTSSSSSPTTSATTTAAPPVPLVALVASATWVRGSGGRSLHVVPTAAGRTAQASGDEARAWAEVLRLAPDADQPGMQAQFDCHWAFARLVQPDKASWNLEPWRPVVSDQQMVDARCNPGGPESADG